MTSSEVVSVLREHGVQPSAQRVAVAEYVLATHEHPSADRVWERVKKGFPMISRATIYNTLNLFVERGLLQQLVLAEGNVVFDPRLEPHHHFIDDRTGKIHDIPWETLKVSRLEKLEGYEVREYSVILRGRRTQSG